MSEHNYPALVISISLLLTSCGHAPTVRDVILQQAEVEALANAPFGSDKKRVIGMHYATNEHDRKLGIVCGRVSLPVQGTNANQIEKAGSRRFIYRQAYLLDWQHVVFDQDDVERYAEIIDPPINDKYDAAYHAQSDQMIHWLFDTLWDSACKIPNN